MEKEHLGGIAIIIALILIVVYGGVRAPAILGTFSLNQQRPLSQNQTSGGNSAGSQTANNTSPYATKVSMYLNRSSDPSREYITIRAGDPSPLLVSGWTVKSLSSGSSATIPKGTKLYFTDSGNSEGDIYLLSGDTMYLSTGKSPNGYSFQVNKCSGYLTRFQNFTPSVNMICPLARNEDLSKIPKYVSNDACFNYIDSYPRCKIETGTLPVEWSPECKNFITNLNYSSCVSKHKDDTDFYQPEWRVFLKRGQSLWKNERETIVLVDSDGKTVSSI